MQWTTGVGRATWLLYFVQQHATLAHTVKGNEHTYVLYTHSQTQEHYSKLTLIPGRFKRGRGAPHSNYQLFISLSPSAAPVVSSRDRRALMYTSISHSASASVRVNFYDALSKAPRRETHNAKPIVRACRDRLTRTRSFCRALFSTRVAGRSIPFSLSVLRKGWLRCDLCAEK